VGRRARKTLGPPGWEEAGLPSSGESTKHCPPRLASFNESDVRDKPPSIRSLLSPIHIVQIDAYHEKRVETLQSVDNLVEAVVNKLQVPGALSSSAALASCLEALKRCSADAAVTCRAAEGSRNSQLRNRAGVSHFSLLRSLKKSGEG
jgi:hypothetical protein